MDKTVESLEKRVAELEEKAQLDHEKVNEMFEATLCTMVNFAENFQIDVPALEELKAKYPRYIKE